MRIDIVKIWFGMANGQISSFLTQLSALYTIMAGILVSRFYYKGNFWFSYIFLLLNEWIYNLKLFIDYFYLPDFETIIFYHFLVKE